MCCFIQGIARAVTSRCVVRFCCLYYMCRGYTTPLCVRRGGAVPYGRECGGEKTSIIHTRAHAHTRTLHVKRQVRKGKKKKKNLYKKSRDHSRKTFTCQTRINYVLHCKETTTWGQTRTECNRRSERDFKILPNQRFIRLYPAVFPPVIDGIRKTVNFVLLFFRRQVTNATAVGALLMAARTFRWEIPPCFCLAVFDDWINATFRMPPPAAPCKIVSEISLVKRNGSRVHTIPVVTPATRTIF